MGRRVCKQGLVCETLVEDWPAEVYRLVIVGLLLCAVSSDSWAMADRVFDVDIDTPSHLVDLVSARQNVVVKFVGNGHLHTAVIADFD